MGADIVWRDERESVCGPQYSVYRRDLQKRESGWVRKAFGRLLASSATWSLFA